MPNNSQEHLNQIIKKERMFYLGLCNRDLAGEMNLGEFANLKSLNASNNKLPISFFKLFISQKKLETINFFGNEIANLDLFFLVKILIYERKSA